MNKIVTAIMCVALTIIGFSSCSAPDSMLEDTRWFLRSYGEKDNVKPIIQGTEITATFNSAKGEVSGSAGCNTYFAGYDVDGSKLSIADIASTEMACMSPEGVMDQEQEFLSLLAGAQSFQADDTALTIFCPGGWQLYFTMAAGSH